MKCIRTKSGKLLRLRTFEALTLVERGLAEFIGKEEYKREKKKGATK